MNEIQKFYYDRMVAALYEANAELLSNIKSKEANSYFRFQKDDTKLSTEIFDSFKEFELFLNNAVCQLNSKVETPLKYTYLNGRQNGHGIFIAPNK